jgi:putative transcriptional regulator
MNKIKELRNSQNISQKQLSALSNISREHLSMIENCKYSPTLETLIKIAKALNCEVKDLL